MQPWQQGGTTRGTEVNTAETLKDLYKSYRVFAWAADSKGNTTPYIMGDTVKSATGKTDADYYWPGAAYNLYFLAFAPSSFADSTTLMADMLTIPYTVPTDVTQQQDILYALSSSVKGNQNSTQELEFQHALTAVHIVFANKDQMATIESVSLDSVYSTATLKYVVKDESVSWIHKQTVGNFTVAKRQNEGEDGTKTDDPEIATNEYTFLMLPQEFSDEGLNKGASLVLHFSDGKVYCKALSELEKNWEAGHRITYTITYNGEDRVFDVPEAVDLAYNATSFTISDIVSEKGSYTEDKTFNKTDNLAWEVVYKPTWLTTSKKENGSLTFDVAENTAYSTGNDAIRSREPAEGVVDLSNGCQNTANCYIINAAGTYKFPLVYGNGLKNGANNEPAYSGDGYVNHLGKSITSPYIYDNDGCVPDHAELLWQDAQGMIKKVSLSDNNTYITFETAGQDDIGQCNALIAVQDADDNILWSWHIWITFYDPSKGTDKVDNWKDKEIISFESGKKYTIMPINLGWCDESTYYVGREDSIILRQTATRENKTIKVIQRPEIIGTNGSQTFYQWNRKDPFIPADVSAGFNNNSTITYPNKKIYDIDGNEIKNENIEDYEKQLECDTKMSIQNMILHPTTFATSFSGSKETWVKTKTIYDPSPVGYMICNRDVMTVVLGDDVNELLSGSSATSKDFKLDTEKINTPYSTTSDISKNRKNCYTTVDEVNGWEFYCYPMKKSGKLDPSGGTFFIPVSLYRAYSKAHGEVTYNSSSGGTGSLYFSMDEETSGAICAGYYGNSIRLYKKGGATQEPYGRAIRCMKE
jgi:hypothetical protein